MGQLGVLHLGVTREREWVGMRCTRNQRRDKGAWEDSLVPELGSEAGLVAVGEAVYSVLHLGVL
jgi:hypothetical protein